MYIDKKFLLKYKKKLRKKGLYISDITFFGGEAKMCPKVMGEGERFNLFSKSKITSFMGRSEKTSAE